MACSYTATSLHGRGWRRGSFLVSSTTDRVMTCGLVISFLATWTQEDRARADRKADCPLEDGITAKFPFVESFTEVESFFCPFSSF